MRLWCAQACCLRAPSQIEIEVEIERVQLHACPAGAVSSVLAVRLVLTRLAWWTMPTVTHGAWGVEVYRPEIHGGAKHPASLPH